MYSMIPFACVCIWGRDKTPNTSILQLMFSQVENLHLQIMLSHSGKPLTAEVDDDLKTTWPKVFT